jgi:hypothetical protein
MPLHPAANPVSRFMIDVYSADRVITSAVVANVCVFVWLAIVTIGNPAKLGLASGSHGRVISSIETRAGRE